MVERASQPSPIITCVRFGAALERETLPPLASVTPMMLVLPENVRCPGGGDPRWSGAGPPVVILQPEGEPSAVGGWLPRGQEAETPR
ncbi:hypothetical protein GCM10010448_64230 [Streptomyces glomeratus]|uniref:Uncharacterized protein n=1 Tax=Streptomyces glomeratus TaxID=284452 RepID=A0ABP6M5K4_9ACTN